jgi:hypothetical protein
MKATHAILAFNRGIVSRLALARIDLKRMALSAAEQINWIPRVLGSMMLRPGLQFLSATRSNAKPRHIPFVFSSSDTAIIELTDGMMRVRIDDVIVRRPAVTATFNRYNGAAFVASADVASTFVDATDVSYWKDNDESGGVSAFATGGYLSLLGNGNASAIRDRSIAVVETYVEHSIAIVVQRGVATLRVGTTEGGEELLTDRLLRAGTHSISVTPTGPTMFVRLSNSRNTAVLVDSVTLGQAAADLEIATPWLEADLKYVRWAQSGDVVFLACTGKPQKRIERQGATSPRSWSVVEYAPEDGPFRELNTGPVQMKVSALTGDITLTAERAYFKSTNVGSLFSLDSVGQYVTERLQAANTFSDPIRVTGVGTARLFSYDITGPTFTATTTVTIQRSMGAIGDWNDVLNFTAVTALTVHDDGMDNQIAYYRIGIKTGNYTAADDITANLYYASGSITGICRVTEFTSETVVSAAVLQDFGRADQYTADWREGDWSDRRGYPSAVEMDGGRLWWAGKGLEWGSVSDAFDSFDDSIESDDGPIRRTLGKGPIDNVNWILSSSNLLFGMEGGVQVARASSQDEPLTQAQFGLKPVSNKGTAPIQAVLLDTSAAYVGNDDQRMFEVPFDGVAYSAPIDMTALCPEIGSPGFVGVAVQNSPDRRLHCWRSDGTVAVLVFDKVENVTCWIEVETDGEVEDIVVLPRDPDGGPEDRVYYAVKRFRGDLGEQRYLERWAEETEAMGAADNRMADSFVVTTTPGLTVTGLDHLEGNLVVVWQDGVCPLVDGALGRQPKTYTVTGGQITLDTPIVSFACVGLPYTATYKSAKGAVRDAQQMLLNQRQKIDTLGVVLADTHPQGLKYGQDFDNMDELPQIEEGAAVDLDAVWTEYDYDVFTVNGTWSTDARLCLKALAPLPCTLLGVSLGEQGNAR